MPKYRLHFCTPMCRELISLLNGIMRYNYMTMVKVLYLDYSQDLMTMTNIFKKVAIFHIGHVCNKVKMSQTHKIIDVMSRESNSSATIHLTMMDIILFKIQFGRSLLTQV